MQTSLHLSSPVARRRFRRLPADLGRHQQADTTLVAREPVRMLGVVAGVGRHGCQLHTRERLIERRAEVRDVRPGTATRHHGQDQMAVAVTNDARLGEPLVGRALPVFPGVRSTFDVVAAGVPRFESGAVDRGQGHLVSQFALPLRQVNRSIEQPSRRPKRQQPVGGFLQGRKVGRFLQFDRLGQVRRVVQQGAHLPIVVLHELFEHQAGEQLRLCEVLAAELARIRPKRQQPDQVPVLQHAAR